MYQQTVEVAIDTSTNQEVWATNLFDLTEAEFAALRRTAMVERLARRNGGSQAQFICAICRRPLYLSRFHRAGGNRWFAHDGASLDCPWSQGGRLSQEQYKAIQYRGQQEGCEHKRLKEFVALWLEKEPRVSEIQKEKVTLGQVLKGEWKRPDVQCVIDGRKLVFELQISYEFLSHVIKRDEFYRQESTFIIWVFRAFEPHRATVTDEAFFNRRNLFVLDETAIANTTQTGRLTFSGFFQEPLAIDGQIKDDWKMRPISLDDVHFPVSNYRPYFCDHSEAMGVLTRELSRTTFQQYLEIAVSYHEGQGEEAQEALWNIVGALRKSPVWRDDLEPLCDVEFFGWHRPLPVLLSIKYNRPIGYDVKTAFQVLEAGLRQRSPDSTGSMGFAVLYLWAYKIFKPTVSKSQRGWVRDMAHKVKNSVEAGEETYRRYTKFDQAIIALFPELENALSTDWAKTFRP